MAENSHRVSGIIRADEFY